MRFTSQTNVGINRLVKLGRPCLFVTAALSALLAVRTLAVADDQSASSDADMSASTTPDGFEKIVLQPGNAQKVTISEKIKRANILIPEIADVVPLGPTELLVTAKKPGMTQLIIWDDQEHTQIINVVVASDIEMLRKQMKTMFPDSDITIDETGGALTLHGHVASFKDAAEAGELASNYGKVLNLLEVSGGEQIMLKVKIAEVSKQAESELGFNFGGTDGTSTLVSNAGPDTFSLATGTTSILPTLQVPTSPTSLVFGGGKFDDVFFDYFVNALETNNILRLLAEPNLVTTSGQEAHFLAGGQIPYPVPQPGNGGSTITIQFQTYGVDLKFVPIVLGNGHIRLKVEPNVSELDYAHSVTVDGTSVPGLTQREVETTVEMAPGQTLALAGLLQDNVTAANSEFPVLGDLPILGALFRSVSYQRNETEVVVMVTPVLVHPMDPASVGPVPGEKWRDPTNFELFMFKDLGGEDISAGNNTTSSAADIAPIQQPVQQAVQQIPSSPEITQAPIRPVEPVTPATPAKPAIVTPAPAAPTVQTPAPAAAAQQTPSSSPLASGQTIPTKKIAPAQQQQPTAPPPLFQGQYGFSPANSNQQQTAGASDPLK
jgi:pilus assembly protein CpaC